jgi:hypothetical protein
VYEIEQSFPTAHTDGLKVLGLFGVMQRFVSFLQRSPAGCQWFNRQIVKRFSLIVRDSQTQTDMKGERQIHIRKLLLRIEICGICNHPPSGTFGMNVPDVMAFSVHTLRVNLLREL